MEDDRQGDVWQQSIGIVVVRVCVRQTPAIPLRLAWHAHSPFVLLASAPVSYLQLDSSPRPTSIVSIMKSIFAWSLGTILVLLALSGRTAAQSCSMSNVIMCPLYSYTIHNDTYCAHDASRPWCTPPQTPMAKSRCTALPPGQIAQIRPGCPKLGVRFLPNGLGNQYTFCQDATDGAIYTRLNVIHDMFYFCATSPDATTPVLPSPQPIGARRDATVESLSEYEQYMLDTNQNNESIIKTHD